VAFADTLIALKLRRPRRVHIASPCPESWDDMFGDEKVRHCEKCHLSVFNLSEMTEDEADKVLSRFGSDRLCIRYYQRADGNVMFKDCPDSGERSTHEPRTTMGRYGPEIGR
jgi:hypothetical protein